MKKIVLGAVLAGLFFVGLFFANTSFAQEYFIPPRIETHELILQDSSGLFFEQKAETNYPFYGPYQVQNTRYYTGVHPMNEFQISPRVETHVSFLSKAPEEGDRFFVRKTIGAFSRVSSGIADQLVTDPQDEILSLRGAIPRFNFDPYHLQASSTRPQIEQYSFEQINNQLRIFTPQSYGWLPYANLVGGYPTHLCTGVAACIPGYVTQHIDGDTLKVYGESVRLALIDAPESGEPGYQEASDFIASTCPIGSFVVVNEDDLQTQGSFDRMVAELYCGRVNVNEAILDAGHATIATFFCPQSEFQFSSWAQNHGCNNS